AYDYFTHPHASLKCLGPGRSVGTELSQCFRNIVFGGKARNVDAASASGWSDKATGVTFSRPTTDCPGTLLSISVPREKFQLKLPKSYSDSVKKLKTAEAKYQKAMEYDLSFKEELQKGVGQIKEDILGRYDQNCQVGLKAQARIKDNLRMKQQKMRLPAS
ncbi:hypothetical protein N9V90_02470, partial [Endozoicomonas sp.]|nr:hypothetical protein [Endozoicomonas sp.]